MKIIIVFVVSLLVMNLQAQHGKIHFSLTDGIIICGYVDGGGYLNFTGPNINFTSQNSKIILGMLPSLRFKKDSGATKNAFVTPNLGVGLTYSYKWVSFQIPMYYNAKTSDLDGRWYAGFGIGLRLNEIRKKK